MSKEKNPQIDLNEINYNKRLTYSKTKMFEFSQFKGVYVETQFKNQRENDPSSDYVNTLLFNEWESFEILRDSNVCLLNSLPIDIIAFMDVPEINKKWFQ